MERDEIWKSLPGYPERYKVSNMGRVSSNGKILKPTLSNRGYLIVGVNGKTPNVHKLVLEAFVGKRPIGMIAGHRNDIKTDNRIDNLRWITRSENQRDAALNGKDARGEKTGGSKLKENQINEILRLYESGWTYREIAKKYGVHRVTIGCVVRKISWRHITCPESYLSENPRLNNS